MIARHFAFFRRDTGQWLGEMRALVPAPGLPEATFGATRLRALATRQKAAIRSAQHVVEQAWDRALWDATPSELHVCVDVTRIGWPVGDHVWHVWDDVTQEIDWPESSVHTFIEVRTDTLEVVANQRSSRPIRDSVPGQHVIDITHTPWAEHFGSIFGRFVWRADEGRWGFEQRTRYPWRWRRPLWSLRHAGRRIPSSPDRRKALAEAPVGLDLVVPVGGAAVHAWGGL